MGASTDPSCPCTSLLDANAISGKGYAPESEAGERVDPLDLGPIGVPEHGPEARPFPVPTLRVGTGTAFTIGYGPGDPGPTRHAEKDRRTAPRAASGRTARRAPPRIPGISA